MGLLLWMATFGLSWSHRDRHVTGSTGADHHACVLCLFAHGQVLAADTVIPSPRLNQANPLEVPLAIETMTPAPQHLRPPGRAPPQTLS